MFSDTSPAFTENHSCPCSVNCTSLQINLYTAVYNLQGFCKFALSSKMGKMLFQLLPQTILLAVMS